MSADLLRKASDKIRESVEVSAAQPQTAATVSGVWLNSRYHPTFSTPAALAVADLLDSAAGHVEYTGDLASEDVVAALTVARAYLGASA